MLFGSLEFLFGFLPPVLIIYHVLRLNDKAVLAKSWLVAASLVFYGWWKISYVPLMLISIGANYAISLLIEKKPRQSRIYLIIGLIGNLGLLGYYKYANFFTSTVSAIAGLDWNARHILLPLAISFFTFQQIAYLVEVYKEKKAADSLLDYSLFVMFFPHLIAGPITHHKEMLPQFKNAGRGKLSPAFFSTGAAVLILGLAKKVVVADTFALVANPIFAAAEHGVHLSFSQAWLGALAYTLQLYYDFSGYSDMAIGLGLLFGIRLPVNFASPYKSTSIIEFWRRWHITLSRFLRQYLYIPFGGNRKGPARRYLNLFLTMLLGGLWHGAGWTFIIWGGLHGAYLIVNHGWRNAFGVLEGVIARCLGWCVTFIAVVLAWVLFRAATFHGALAILGAMVPWPQAAHAASAAPPSLAAWVGVIVALIGSIALPNALEMARYPVAIAGAEEAEGAPLRPLQWRLSWVFTGVFLGFIGALALAKLPDPGIFLYFNF
ncbi:MBOAT family protein [Caulobacter sp. S45]|uniref:MBOAT family O-acyltransferase n=1 Tax=Caulobacter sp. S45 TaxID=1641861 RepID=UPI00131B2EAE|nr:MBOAT family protein [Caulobacter sp. S45]